MVHLLTDQGLVALPGVTASSTRVSETLESNGMIAVVRHVMPTDLELLRHHRNRPEVRRYLWSEREITVEQQRDWFARTHAIDCRIVELRYAAGEIVPIGLARVGPDDLVGCDAFAPGRGHGTIVFDAACRLQAYIGHSTLSLWVFRGNASAVSIYEHAGFRYDTSAEVQWLVRDFGRDGPQPQAYVRMIFEVQA